MLILHFGFFHLLSLGWRRGRRVNADAHHASLPLAATSLAAVLGRALEHRLQHSGAAASVPPARGAPRRNGLPQTLASGSFSRRELMHEAGDLTALRGAASGLPMAYFALQGAGVLLRAQLACGSALGLGHGWRPWLAVHASWSRPCPSAGSFIPPFVRNVILPMLEAIGATSATPMNTTTLLLKLACAHLCRTDRRRHPAAWRGGLREHTRTAAASSSVNCSGCTTPFIGLCLVSFGLGTFLLAEELASGTPLARARVRIFLAVFWSGAVCGGRVRL